MKHTHGFVVAAGLFAFSTTACLADDSENLAVFNTDGSQVSDALAPGNLSEVPPVPFPSWTDEDRDAIQQIAPQLRDRDSGILAPEIEAGVAAIGVPEDADVTEKPYNRAGKLFLDFATTRGHCTAEFVGATDVLMTAAHCVNFPGFGLAKDLSFYRAWDNGGGEQFSWHCYARKAGWDNTNSTKWDFAFIKLDRAGTVGASGLRVGPDTGTTITALGYPSNFPQGANAGEVMQTVDGNYIAPVGNITTMQNNPYLQGASGGLWFTKSDPGMGFSLTSRKSPSGTDTIHGPEYTNEVVDLLDFVKRGCK